MATLHGARTLTWTHSHGLIWHLDASVKATSNLATTTKLLEVGNPIESKLKGLCEVLGMTMKVKMKIGSGESFSPLGALRWNHSVLEASCLIHTLRSHGSRA